MGNKKARKLLNRYLKDECTPEEKAIVETWFLKTSRDSNKSLPEPDYDSLKNNLWQTIERKNNRSKKVLPLWHWIAIASGILIILSIGLLFNNRSPKVQTYTEQTNIDIAPGSNKAFLILADGSKISLNDVSAGSIATQAGMRITKSAEGHLVYEAIDKKSVPGSVIHNKIETPKGGQYQIKLPDGTIVWLNAASSLKYPVSFSSLKSRTVELTGEGYFDITPDKNKPFVVTTSKQQITVLGTKFNVNAYADESNTTTTLIHGSLRITTQSNTSAPKTIEKILKPGEQSKVHGAEIEVDQVDTEEAISWKNGQFMFTSESIATIMRKISRWYDIEVEYTGDVAGKRFTGTISRYVNVSEVLQTLELTNRIHFKIKGRKIIVSD